MSEPDAAGLSNILTAGGWRKPTLLFSLRERVASSPAGVAAAALR